MWASPGRPTAAFQLLTGAFVLRQVGDFFWNVRVVSTAASKSTVRSRLERRVRTMSSSPSVTRAYATREKAPDGTG